MTIKLGQRSRKNLEGVHPHLVKVIEEAAKISDLDFTVTEGRRSIHRQKLLVERGASKTMKSRHLTGHAVDLAVLLKGKLSWDWPLYHKLAAIVKKAAANVGVPIEWGGDWKTFKDGPHFQLPWDKYP